VSGGPWNSVLGAFGRGGQGNGRTPVDKAYRTECNHGVRGAHHLDRDGAMHQLTKTLNDIISECAPR